MRRIATLGSALLLLVSLANATSRSNNMQITVLDSETRALPQDNNGVPNNCDQLTFDAYCRSSRVPSMVSTLLVQEGNDPPFRISCTIESRNSRCTPLPKGATFDARREKKGVTVYFVDDKGKARKEFYTLVDAAGKPAALAAVTTPPIAAAAQDSGPAPAAPAAGPAPAAPRQNPAPRLAASPISRAPSNSTSNSNSAASSNAASPGPGWVQVVNPQKVRCNFSSTPAGAEISVDGNYVGNTPSAVSLTTGTHSVTLSLSGFAPWKRDLAVLPDSDLNISPVLQKQ